MAEFVQTMKDWCRMCLSYKSCDDCPMMDADVWAHILCSEGGIQTAVPEIQETVIEKWAAEHPEPVYPTWFELAVQQGFKIEEGKQCTDEELLLILLMASVNTPIPADIAQKLGIEPKEDV